MWNEKVLILNSKHWVNYYPVEGEIHRQYFDGEGNVTSFPVIVRWRSNNYVGWKERKFDEGEKFTLEGDSEITQIQLKLPYPMEEEKIIKLWQK